MGKPIIELKHFSYRYPNTEELVLKDINLTIDEGDLYIETYNDVRGWLMFNSRLNDGEGGFTLYESSVQFDLYMPSVYRLTIVK